jgi:hypothetical protein
MGFSSSRTSICFAAINGSRVDLVTVIFHPTDVANA